MKSYSEREVFSVSELMLRNHVALCLVSVEHLVDGQEVRCHELVRAVARVFDMPDACVEDGWYGMVDHSWLWTKPRTPLSALPNVLDVYAVGRLPQVQLVHTSPRLPFEFRRGDHRKDIDDKVVRKLVTTMRAKKTGVP